jgi:hypothetical protein
MMSNIRVTIDMDDSNLAGCQILKDEHVEQFENLPRQDQIHICNSFVMFYQLFSKVIKEN